ncbi:MAG: ATP synthase F1 subunit epsilon [Prevotella sp.]|nr:ATP synthase F1 subunit epsilon [Prevotella sp.]
MSLKLRIVSPEKIEFVGEVESVLVPGTLGSFEILNDHAPIISSLQTGIVEYSTKSDSKRQMNITGGFVAVHKNEVNLCVEVK